MGTPEFAVAVLRRLLAPDSPLAVVGVVTQPDRPAGRSGRPVAPPVKTLAVAHGLPVLQPPSLRRPAAVAAVGRMRPDIAVVAAYGEILRPGVLALAGRGFLNVHGSLLPRWRGAWPVGAAILAGDTETGVSIMRLDEGMDTGPVLARRAEPVRPDDTTATLQDRLAAQGADLLMEVLPAYLAGTLVPVPQDDHGATYCHTVRKADGRLDWTRSAVELERLVRAMQPWPVAWTTWDGQLLRVLRARALDALPAAPPRLADDGSTDDRSTGEPPAGPGQVVRLGKGAAVTTGKGWLALDEVQLEGRGAVPGAAFVNGHRTFPGSILD
jgi:methionyl-tRNA formyltransferase